MSVSAIEAHHVSKRYRIGIRRESYLSLRDEIAKFFSPSARRARRVGGELWALRDVGFDIHRGESIGIIGRNGAGKSTLLKVLSQVTSPTEGEIVMRGRVASLLEVGTGFHPELTGRENVFLNGTILGMTRREIVRKFDEIIAFAEVERFVDTPVKRYSSGMYVRLAFAVAAHLEPEILVVDEVLAVGDAQFQKKCLGKMDAVTKEGRTVLFVSHNMGAIGRLCGRAMLLDRGHLVEFGPTEKVIETYLENIREANIALADIRFPPDPAKRMQITALRILGADNKPSSELDRMSVFKVVVEYEVREPVEGAVIELVFEALVPSHAFVIRSYDTDTAPARAVSRKPGRYSATLTFPGNLFNAGNYRIRSWVWKDASGGALHDEAPQGLEFCLYDTGTIASFGIGHRGQQRPGILAFPIEWTTVIAEDRG